MSNLFPARDPLEIIEEHIRTIKLPELLSKVDNELRFSRCFMPAADQAHPEAQHVCEVLASDGTTSSSDGQRFAMCRKVLKKPIEYLPLGCS